MTVLDFGCGPGFFTLDLADLVGPSGRVIAADLQPGMLERLRVKARGTALEARIELHQCQPNQIGLSSPVDFALAFYVLHELPDPEAVLSELRSLLTDHGRVLVVEPPLHVTRAAFEATLQVARRAGFRIADRPRLPFNKAVLLQPG
jgi:ubiquinone/menaquinone biosynthesis C-methylase UbiE